MAESIFATFKATFKGDLVTAADPDYAVAISRWAINAERRAKIVAFVKDETDVVAAIAYARANHLPLAIRGGGHSPAGSSSVEDGLVIDLSRYLNNVRIDPDKKLAYSQGGALWRTVDEAAIAYGLATVAGVVNHTGVGGLTLGGGYGWLSGEHGLVIDCLVQVTIVTADGSILKANATENFDLFWGIRGGGCNFGICTEFVAQLFPQRRTVFGSTLVFPPTVREELAACIDARKKAGLSPKEGSIVFFTRSPDGKPCIVVALFYNGSEEEGRQIFKSIYDLKPLVEENEEIPYEKLNARLLALVPAGSNAYWKGALSTGSVIRDLSSTIFDRVIELSASGDISMSVAFEYFPLEKINSVPASATPYRRNLTDNVVVQLRWPNDTPEKSRIARDAAHQLAGLVDDTEVSYGNYSADSVATGAEAVDRAKSLYGEHYAKMQALKKIYDPDVVFNKWFVITPAV